MPALQVSFLPYCPFKKVIQVRPGLRPRRWPRPPPPPALLRSPSPSDLPPRSGPRSQVPARRHGAALGPGAQAAAAAALRPAAPGGARQGRYRPPPRPAPPPPAGAGIPKEALSSRPSLALLFCPAAGPSTGLAGLGSLTPNSCFPGSVISAPGGQRFAPGSGE